MFQRYLKKSNAVFARTFHYQSGVAQSPNHLTEVFRVDKIANTQSNLKFSLFELFMFRIAMRQHPITAYHVAEHQGSTELIGTTSSRDIVKHLAKQWPHRNTILTIDTSFLKELLIDVVNTVHPLSGISFFQSRIVEREHALTALPLYAIQSFEMLHSPDKKLISNPFYINPSNHNTKLVHAVLNQQMHILEQLYMCGKTMSSTEIQQLLNRGIDLIDQLFQATMGQDNPLRMSVAQYQTRYGSELTQEQLQYYPQATLIIDVLTKDGHTLFLHNNHYTRLIEKGDLAMRQMIEQNNQENGYSKTPSLLY